MITYNGSVLTVNGSWLAPGPYNPLNLPSHTMRFQFGYAQLMNTYNPTTSGQTWKTGAVWTQVSSRPNVWDYTRASTDWSEEFYDAFTALNAEKAWILGANTSGITNMYATFRQCSAIVSMNLFDTSSVTNMSRMFDSCTGLAINYVQNAVPLFDTSSVTNMSYMFYRCQNLYELPLFDTSSVTDMSSMLGHTAIYTSPLFDTSSVTDMSGMFYECRSLSAIPLFDTSSVYTMRETFYECTNVASGALDLYNQASSQATPPFGHSQCFYNCGSNTTTGAAELAQIPSSWGGTGS